MNIVLDTNTVISGLFWKDAPRQVLDLARSGTFALFTSPDLLSELADVLGRKNSLKNWRWRKQVLKNWFLATLRWQKQCARSKLAP